MKETIEEYVKNCMLKDWGGHQHWTAQRGYFNVPKVRDGGATAKLIDMAAKAAQRYWNEENEELD